MKKKSVGIIAEYNPFHNGHLYHLNRSRDLTEAEICIAAMSGNFVQRGQPAIADKWLRAEAAVSCGVDLVVEIPVVFACNSASYFAKAGVEILENLGADYISFGSESGNIQELEYIARVIKENRRAIETEIQMGTKSGNSYPKMRGEVLSRLIGTAASKLIESPNNILAIEYLQHIKSAKAVTVMREGPGYNDTEERDGLASATAIRRRIKENRNISRLLPGKSADVLGRSQCPSDEIFFKMLCQRVLSAESDELDRISAGGEGLGNKLKNLIRSCKSYEEVVEGLKSKRYTRTRIERFLIQTMLEIESVEEYTNYIRVLAFNQKGSAYLKEIKKSGKCKLPVITNINKDLPKYPKIFATLSRDILATDIYNLAAGRDLYDFSEYVKKPFAY